MDTLYIPSCRQSFALLVTRILITSRSPDFCGLQVLSVSLQCCPHELPCQVVEAA